MSRRWPQTLVREGIEAIVLRTFNDRPATLWESVLPEECRRLPAELEAVDALLDDERFFAPYRAFFDPVLGRPSIPIETYLRMMFLKFRYRLGFETLCREVTDSLSWRRFCRIGLGEAGAAPDDVDEDHHPLRARHDRRVERDVVGQGGRGQGGAPRQGAGRHHRGRSQRRLPDRLGTVGPRGGVAWRG